MTTLIDTQSGPIQGHKHANLTRFLGIPYALAPVGEQRWLPPLPVPAWQQPLQADHFGSACVQQPSQMTAELPGGLEGCSEDCLSLNIWAPNTANDKPLPVMVWLHGGGFTIGGSSQAMYDGTSLAQRGEVIVVSINYRLGVFGFLRLCDVTNGAVPTTGNEGLLDQIAALKWLRQNIAAFGGDADNVTLFGESAGAMAISTLMCMPAARGLFHKAISQSGRPNAAHSIERANRIGELFIKSLPEAAQRDPANASPEDLMFAQRLLHGRMMFSERLSTMPMKPVVDGEHLPALPLDIMRAGKAMAVPLLIGCNRDEFRYFSLLDKGLRTLDEATMHKRLQFSFDEAQIAQLLSAYEHDAEAKDAPFKTFCAISGDMGFRISTERGVKALASRQDVYEYQFEQSAPGLGGLLGACHVSEVGYIFDTLDTPLGDLLFARDATARNVATQMIGIWSDFARTGKPQINEWPAYGERAGRYHINSASNWQAMPSDDIEAFWSSIDDDFLTRV